MLAYQLPTPYLAPLCLIIPDGWVGGPTVIIGQGLVSVQLYLKLDLPTGTELGNNV